MIRIIIMNWYHEFCSCIFCEKCGVPWTHNYSMIYNGQENSIALVIIVEANGITGLIYSVDAIINNKGDVFINLFSTSKWRNPAMHSFDDFYFYIIKS